MARRNIKFLFGYIFILVISTACNNQLLTRPKINENVNSSVNIIDAPQPGQVAVIDSNIIINQPLSNDVVSSPLEISGRARSVDGAVFFRLKDSWSNEVATSSVIAASGDSTWGYYKGTLEFEMPKSQTGLLEVYVNNSENGNEHNLISLPIVFKDYKNLEVDVYFSNTKKDPGMLDCSSVYSVKREVRPTNRLAMVAVEELLLGVDNKEAQEGFMTSIPEKVVKIQKLEIKDNIVYIDFNQALQEGVGGSCRVTAIRSQITQTLKSLQDIKDVVISIDGNAEDILQP